MIKFLQFGCWNNMNVKKGKSLGNLPQVMTSIKNYIANETLKTNFIVIAGDNYYPEKIKPTETEKKKKLIHTQYLKDGFESLPNNIEIDMILGNHDLETNLKKNTLYVDNLENIEKGDCYILNSEENIEKQLNQNGKLVNLFLFNAKMLNGTLLIMIDTSMYSIDAKQYLPCYNNYLKTIGKSPVASVDEIIIMQNEFILSTIRGNSDKIKNLIMVGHHPIIGVKYKSSLSKVELLDDIPSFTNIIEMIYNNTKVPFFYLCADLHLFQSGTIYINGLNNGKNVEIKIQQYIVGTGGTELDENVPNNFLNNTYERNTLEDKNMKYVIQESICDFGFLECMINENPEFKFISSSISSIVKGGKRKRTKKKRVKTCRKVKTKRKNKFK